MATKLRKDFIKLLEKDEEFRYAVAGYIGLADISKSLTKLVEAHARAEERLTRLEDAVASLEKVVQRLAEAQAKTEERVTRLEDAVARLETAVQKLAEAQAKTEERVTWLEEAVERLEAAVQRLTEAQAKTEERVTGLEEVVGRLEAAVQRLAEAQAGSEERLTRLEKVVEKLAEAQASSEERLTRLEVSFHELARQVGKLSDTIGFGLEDIAKVVLPGWLSRHEGIEVEELTRTFMEVDGEVVEINLYGEGVKDGEPVVILGESRSRIYENDVKEFDEAVEKVKRVIPNRVYKLLFGYWIHPKAQREAANRGLKLIASYMR